MCLGSMSLPNVGSTIPATTSELFPSDVPARQAQPGVRDDSIPVVVAPTVPSVPSPTSEAAPGAIEAGASGDGRSSGSTGTIGGPGGEFIIPGGLGDGGVDEENGIGEGEGGGGRGDGGGESLTGGGRGEDEENGIGEGEGGGGDDDINNRIVDDEGDATDDTKEKLKEREDEEGPTTSPARIVSPLIRAVQGDRQIDRRGRNALFIPQGTKHGERRVKGRMVNSASRTAAPVIPSPVESGLIPLRR